MTRRESATAKEVVNSTASKIHSHPDVSQVEPGIEPATMIVSRFRRSRIQAVPTISNNLCPSVSLYCAISITQYVQYLKYNMCNIYYTIYAISISQYAHTHCWYRTWPSYAVCSLCVHYIFLLVQYL